MAFPSNGMWNELLRNEVIACHVDHWGRESTLEGMGTMDIAIASGSDQLFARVTTGALFDVY